MGLFDGDDEMLWLCRWIGRGVWAAAFDDRGRGGFDVRVVVGGKLHDVGEGRLERGRGVFWGGGFG